MFVGVVTVSVGRKLTPAPNLGFITPAAGGNGGGVGFVNQEKQSSPAPAPPPAGPSGFSLFGGSGGGVDYYFPTPQKIPADIHIRFPGRVHAERTAAVIHYFYWYTGF